MAARSDHKIALVSEESGFRYTTTRNKKNGQKLRLKKFDPWLKKHCWFKEEKIKS